MSQKINSTQYSQIVNDFNSGISAGKIGKKIGAATSTICRILQKNGIDTSLKQYKYKFGKLCDKKEQIIKFYQDNRTMSNIANKFNCSDVIIGKILKENNIKTRKRDEYKKYYCNENFFENIDNEEKAYTLGLWYADGYNNEKRKYIKLSMIDYDIIQKIKQKLNFNGIITSENPKKSTHKKIYCLCIHSKKISQDLTKLGCVQRKTYCAKFPNNISNDLMAYFIRGLFDGDGCIYYHKKSKRWLVVIIGTRNICEGLKNYLNYGNIYLHKKNLKNNHETWAWQTQKQKYIKTFLDWIYQDSTIHLNRKYNKYQEFLIDYNNKV